MDPFTHALVGAAIASPRASSRKCLIFGALGGLFPDIDVLIHSAANPLLFIEYHRQFTHSLAFAPVAALLLALPFHFIKKTRDHFGDFFLALLLGILSHDLLDACTSYGTQLYWPFANTRVAFDVVNIVDPIITLILLWSVFWTWKKNNSSSASWGLCFLFVYLVFGKWQNTQALAAQAQLASLREQPISHNRVMPTFGNIFVWRSIYQTGDDFQTDMIRVDPFGNQHVRQGYTQPILKIANLPNPVLKKQIELFSWFADGYIALYPGNVIGDLRYSFTPEGTTTIWGLQFNPLSSQQSLIWQQNKPKNVSDLLKSLWLDVISTKHLRALPKGKTTV